MASPSKRPHMQFYPQKSANPSQVWHFEKWLKDAPDSVLTPVAALGPRHFYVNELVRCRDDTYFIPRRWVIDEEGRMSAAGDVVDLVEVLVCTSTSLRQHFSDNVLREPLK